jgi:uncharacterized protein with HEPN domain
MTNETKKRLLDALVACRAIQEFTTGIDFTGYAADAMRLRLTPQQLELPKTTWTCPLRPED